MLGLRLESEGGKGEDRREAFLGGRGQLNLEVLLGLKMEVNKVQLQTNITHVLPVTIVVVVSPIISTLATIDALVKCPLRVLQKVIVPHLGHGQL